MSTQKTQSRQNWIGIIISLISLGAILFFVKPIDIWEALKHAEWSYVLLMVVGLVVFLVFRAVRWQFMLTRGTPWRSVFHIQNIGYMFNMTLPLRIGDMARAVLIGNVPPSTLAGGLSTMVVERLLDMLFVVTLLPFTVTAVTVLPEIMRNGAQFFGYVSIAGIVMLLVAANKRPFAINIATIILNKIPFLDTKSWTARLDNFLSGLNSLTNLKDSIILLGLSIIVWLPIIFTYYIGMRAFGIQPSPTQVGFLFCAAALSVAAPSAPGQVGVFHGGVIAAVVALGFNEDSGAALAIVYHAVNLVTMVAMGFIALSRIGTTFDQVLQSARGFLSKSPS